MEPVTLKDGVFWVGAIDWNVREFHGYSTDRGTTYNAYLIKGEKTALVDTVKAEFFPEMMARIEAVIDPAKIDYLIVNHVEMDHSGSLPRFMERAPKAQIVATDNGVKGLDRHYRDEFPKTKVKTGEEISLGNKTLQFLEAYMLHWPDSMFTYLKEDRVLLPNDGFGQHYASFHRFDDELDGLEAVMDEAAKYFSNILMPLAPLIPPLLKKVEKMGLQIEMIAPSHGIIWRKDIEGILNKYLQWISGYSVPKVIIPYDSMWNSTKSMAYAIAEGVASQGVECRVYSLTENHRSDIITDILEARAILVGSPTLNNHVYPTVAEFLAYMRGLKPMNKLGAAFGSYGWGGGAKRFIEEQMKLTDIELIENSLDYKFKPTDDEWQSAYDFGVMIAKKVKE